MNVGEFQGSSQSNQIVYPIPDPNVSPIFYSLNFHEKKGLNCEFLCFIHMSLIFNQVGAVPSEDVDLHINMNLFKLASTAEDRKYYSEKIAQESMVSVDI